MIGENVVSPEIRVGTRVLFNDPGWAGIYGIVPIYVNSRVGNYISLKNEEGEILPLGGGEGLISVGHVKLWEP